jgi:hypothetical protein
LNNILILKEIMTKLDRTHKVGIILGALLFATLILNWRLIFYYRPYNFKASAIIGGTIEFIFIFGSLFGTIGLFFKKTWGCIASYFAATGATSIGISIIPWISKLSPAGYARNYAVLGLNAIFITTAVTLHVNLHRIKVRMANSANN